MTLPAEVELCARPRDGGLLCLGRVHRPQASTTYCSKCGATDGETAVYTRASRAAATEPPA